VASESGQSADTRTSTGTDQTETLDARDSETLAEEELPESFEDLFINEGKAEDVDRKLAQRLFNPQPLDDYQEAQDPYGPIVKDLDNPLADVGQHPDTEDSFAHRDDFADAINDAITAYVGKHPQAALITQPTNTPAPAPAAVADALYAQIQKDRAKAKASPAFHANDFAPRSYNLVANVNNWYGFGTKIRTWFEDAAAPMRQFFAQALGKGSEDLPINHAYSLFPGRQREVLNRLTKDVLSPLVTRLTALAKAKSLSLKQLYTMADYIPTAFHVLTEAHPMHQRGLERELAAAFKALTKINQEQQGKKSTTKSVQELAEAQVRFLKAHVDLELYNNYQETGQPITLTEDQAMALSVQGERFEAGQEYIPEVPSGVPIPKHRQLWTELRKVFSEQEMNEIKDLTVQGYKQVTEELIRGGLITEEEYQNFPEFTNYVSLAIPYDRSGLQGEYPWSFVYNVRRTDYHRHGSRIAADGAITLLHKAVNSAAERIGRSAFDQELIKAYELMSTTPVEDANGRKVINTHGLKLARMTSDETGFVGAARNNINVMRAPGFIIRHNITDKNGNTRRVSSKAYWEFRDPEQTKIMNKAISQEKNQNGFLRFLTKANSLHGSFFTKLRMSFAPLSMIKDAGERLFNTWNHETLYRADGSTVEGTTIVARMGGLLANPDFYSAYFQTFVQDKVVDTPLGKILQEFKHSGANFTQLSMMKSLGRDIDKLKEMQDLSRSRWKRFVNSVEGLTPVKKANDFFTKWNDSFNAFAPALQYAALRLENISASESAGYTLDKMNYYKEGNLDSIGSAFYVFWRPTIQGGANLFRALNPFGKSTAKARYRAAATALALIALGLMCQTVLRALGAPDDDDKEQVNKYDALPWETVSRSMVILGAKGEQYKAPLSYGGVAGFWAVSVALDRMMNGLMSPAEATYRMFGGLSRQIIPDATPGYMFTEHPIKWSLSTFLPQLLRPLVDVGVGLDFFGSEINKGNQTPGKWEYEKGRINTPIRWHKFARAAAETSSLLDNTPETWRYIVEGYLWGPLAATVGNYNEDNTLIPKSRRTTESVLGPVITAMGGQSLYSAPSAFSQNYYFTVKDRLDDRLKKNHIQLTRPGERRTHEEKIEDVRKDMKKAGFTKDEITAQILIMETELEYDKLEEEAREYRPLIYDDKRTPATLRNLTTLSKKMDQTRIKAANKLSKLNILPSLD
jgi:hypothetical protein